MTRLKPRLLIVFASVLLASGLAQAERYPTPAQRKNIRTAQLWLSPIGARALLESPEWCQEVEHYLGERGVEGVSVRHQVDATSVVVDLPPKQHRFAAAAVVRKLAQAPAPLSVFRAHYEVRRYDNSVLRSAYDGEHWKAVKIHGPDPIPFTRNLLPGYWMISVDAGAGPELKISLWDKLAAANPMEVQAIIAMPDGRLHRSRKVPWFPGGVEVNAPSDFPTLQGRKLGPGAYRVIFEADALTIERPTSLPFHL